MRPLQTGVRTLLLGGGVLAALLVLDALPLGASWAEVEALFRRGLYDEAERQALAEESLAERPGEETLWRIRLERDPETALAMIRSLARQGDLPEGTRIQLALEEASIEFARGRYTAVLQVLEPLADRARTSLPGLVHLLLGMSYRALGQKQDSRDALATITPADQEFGWARLYLGQLALAEGDAELALRYFDSAASSDSGRRLPSLQTGIWEARRMAGRLDDAGRVAQDLLEDHPQSLAALRLRELEDRQAEETRPAPVEVADEPVTPPETRQRGRLTLQLAAFSDRGRALAFLDRWRPELPNLEMVEEEGPDGRLLYKLRTGRYLSRPQANSEAERLRRNHGLEVMIVELGR